MKPDPARAGSANPAPLGAAGGAAGAFGVLTSWYARHSWVELPSPWLVLPLALLVGALVGTLVGLTAAALAGRSRMLGRVATRLAGTAAFLLSLGVTARLAHRLDALRGWEHAVARGPATTVAWSLAAAALAACGVAWIVARWRDPRGALAGLGAVLLATGVGAASVRVHPDRGEIPRGAPRAVLLVTIDTLRADHLGVYGYPRETSPQIDALAREGTVFERAYAAMPSTDPSHAAILTGREPRELGLTANGLSALRGDTIAAWFRARGYATGAITSRAHLNPAALRLNGFESFSSPSAAAGSVEASNTLDRARRWLAAHADQPFFLWVHFWDPHTPYDPPPGPERAMFVPDYRGPFERARSLRRDGDPPIGAETLAYATRLYDGEVRYVDSRVGELVHAVRTLAGAANTLVVLAADHGESLGELDAEHRFAFGHGYFLNPFELRVPLVVAWPGRVPAEARWPDPVSLVALAPTLARLAGGSFGETRPLPGLDLDSADRAAATEAFSQRQEFRSPPNRVLAAFEGSVVDGPWMLVENPECGRILYDARPSAHGPLRNLAAGEPDRVARLASRLRVHLAAHPQVAADTTTLTAEKRQSLSGLGYVH
ncbi:MAG: sulfatase [Acidobacteria bacterium]|nr:sulfatase [Acidobacteriota bacterium]